MIAQFAKKIFPIAFYILLFIFLFLYLRDVDFSKFNNVTINWYYIFIAGVLLLVARFFGVYIWYRLLKGLGAKQLDNPVALAYIYSKSWLGRYIPGSVTWIVGKVYFAAKHGISKNKLAVSSLLEAMIQILVIMLVAFVMLVVDPRIDEIDASMKLMALLIVVLLIGALMPPIFNRFVGFAYRILRKKPFPKEHQATGKTILTGASLYTVAAIIGAVPLFFVIKAVYPEIVLADLTFVIGAASLATAIGMLAIFAPSGLGVREGVSIVLLSIIMPSEFALIATVAARIMSVVTDVIFFGLSWTLTKLPIGLKTS